METSLISPHAIIGEGVQIGEFCIIEDGVEIGDYTVVKNYVELRRNTKIGKRCYVDSAFKSSGDVVVGDNCTLRYNAILARKVTVGSNVFIAPNVMTIYSSHKGEQIPGTVIEDDCFIGTAAVLNHGVKIVSGSVIGTMSFVTKDCLEKGIYTGIPAKLYKEL